MDKKKLITTSSNSIRVINNSISKKVYLKSYGCQMNFSDSEIISSILLKNGYTITQNLNNVDIILLNTCSIREKAESTVNQHLTNFKSLKKQNKNLKIGILGCMAERLKSALLAKKLVDLVVGPDAYKDLPNLLKKIENGEKYAINVALSKKETYEDIKPIRINKNKVSAFITITRGCDNMCTFCIVPFTRGRERSRDPNSILEECQDLVNKEYKEVILLGQNVDSYLWFGGGAKKDFYKATNIQKKTAVSFSDLLAIIAKTFPQLLIRFLTSNPQDMSLDVFYTMSKYSNICKYVHLPIQSGSNSVLKRMNRKYTREKYLELIKKAKEIVPEIAFSHDIIVGFCGETEDEHKDTLSLMQEVQYDFGYMFSYSNRPGTIANKTMKDDVPNSVKKERLIEVIKIQKEISKNRMKNYVGKSFKILIEGESKKSNSFWYGRTSQNAVVIFPKTKNEKLGNFVEVKVNCYTSATLFGELIH